jgi:hypothetical protein
MNQSRLGLSTRARWWISVGGALLLPFVVTTILMVIDHGTGRGGGDWLFPILSLLFGLACWFVAPMSEIPKLVIAAVYVFLMGVLQFGYAMSFVCGVYRNCP